MEIYKSNITSDLKKYYHKYKNNKGNGMNHILFYTQKEQENEYTNKRNKSCIKRK